ncbi:MAG: amidohydrolase family protein [Gaiellaceae bacterium]
MRLLKIQIEDFRSIYNQSLPADGLVVLFGPNSAGKTSVLEAATELIRTSATHLNQEILWNAVRTNVLQAISTDHCAYLFNGQKDAGKDDFRQIPNGGPGLENRLQMIHHFGVREGRISLNRMVELLCTNPAKLFGLYPRKGTLAVGSDADVVVFDPDKRVTISAATHHSRSDYNLYEGTEVQGSPEIVLLRGNVIVDGEQLLAKPGSGQFIKRARPNEELTSAALATA